MSDGGKQNRDPCLKAASLVTAFAWWSLAGHAHAQEAGTFTYDINQTINGGTVTGQIVTNGKSGPLSQDDIISWNLTLSSDGATTNLVSSNSQVLIQGLDLVGSSQDLTFNYSGSGGVMLFQKSLFSGQEYWCAQSTSGPCLQGGSIVPESIFGSTAATSPLSGIIVIGTAAVIVPTESIEFSFIRLADARISQVIDSFTKLQVLLGLNDLINCSDSSGGGYVSFGSLDVATNGRIVLSDSLTLLGGISVGRSSSSSTSVPISTGGALALRYDPADMGSSRPFLEIGAGGSYKDMKFLRGYETARAAFTTTSRANGYDFSAYAKVGWVSRLSRRDELAITASVSGIWQGVSAYEEATGADNPFPAIVPKGTDEIGIVSFNAHYTHLFPSVLGTPVEFNINGGVHHFFTQNSGISAQVAGMNFDPERPEVTYFQLGGRLGVNLNSFLKLDLFVNSTLAPKRIGSAVHGGFGFRTSF